jgi:ribosome-associated translation inhibitor RaiA
MNVSIRARHLGLSEPLQRYAERRLRFSIGSLRPRLADIELRLEDVNGPRGGIDKLCVIAAVLKPNGRIVVQATDSDAYSAIDRAASRARVALVRRLRRGREARRSESSVVRSRWRVV